MVEILKRRPNYLNEIIGQPARLVYLSNLPKHCSMAALGSICALLMLKTATGHSPLEQHIVWSITVQSLSIKGLP